ncbi:RNA polymerase sigma factor SigM [Streptomyces sp. NPDC005438]|uniref:RNA polymerase sigma factor SigM n=1 Tax=Streptomyces sp. NPDC005438 TaxID=3156880 RepID=UPI0033A6A791
MGDEAIDAALELDQLSDRELLARHVEGNPDAFGEIVRRHRDRLWAVAVRTLGDRDEAADAVQDALISAYRAAGKFQGKSQVTTWLHRITVNACLDRARKASTRRTSLTDDYERLDQMMEPQESPEVPAEQRDLRRELTEALETLPVEQRSALVLVDMQGYPVAEAAKMLDVAVGTVKSRCARGRSRLLPLLSHLRPGAPEEVPGSRRPAGGNQTGGRPVSSPESVSSARSTGRSPGSAGSADARGPARSGALAEDAQQPGAAKGGGGNR